MNISGIKGYSEKYFGFPFLVAFTILFIISIKKGSFVIGEFANELVGPTDQRGSDDRSSFLMGVSINEQRMIPEP
jgi:hypothetical protein